ncbi:hypothetical protein SKAU_G00193200 [Synaphobranchus kaupii]|uniref:Reverse transcriptase/retrotransposon-derived protein RNase H-like domain-containing protein n=1 Tax=Synaphobranchus kaupii TaxID=118154 RepID=A0A9Q1FE40_SYNKA|nr:hypothetical protein SKAU_G00193200 [Synaphobranchus kaupii]
MRLIESGVATAHNQFSSNVVFVGCGGCRVRPKSVFNVEMEAYGCKVMVPTLVVQGQHDDLILGTNVIKHILRQYKQCDNYWKAVSTPCAADDPESKQLLSMIAGLTRWRREDMPVKIGTVRCNSAFCLKPGCEYLIWGKLPKSTVVSPGSAVMMELTTCRSAPREILVRRNAKLWTADQEQAFQKLKMSLVDTVVLAHPDFTRPFMLSTDASLDGISAVLSQIRYGMHIMMKPKLDCCEQRWVAKLAGYNFDIKYGPGSQNVVAESCALRQGECWPQTAARALQKPFI